MGNSSKGQFELAMMLGMLIFIGLTTLIILIGGWVQGKQTYRINRKIKEPNKFEIATNSFLEYRDIRKSLVNHSIWGGEEDHIEDALSSKFPKAKSIGIKVNGETLGDELIDVEDFEDEGDCVEELRKEDAYYPADQCKILMQMDKNEDDMFLSEPYKMAKRVIFLPMGNKEQITLKTAESEEMWLKNCQVIEGDERAEINHGETEEVSGSEYCCVDGRGIKCDEDNTGSSCTYSYECVSKNGEYTWEEVETS